MVPSPTPRNARRPDAPQTLPPRSGGGPSAAERIAVWWRGARERALIAASLGGIVGAALLLRSALLVDRVIGRNAVWFLETDPWYHMRLIDNLVRNFPHRLVFDPYLFFPGGQPVDMAPLLDLLVAGVALVLGRGAPSPRTIELAGAWLPPLLGALSAVPVYAIGKRMFGRLAGLFAAALLAVAPGLFLARSLLGYTDHHVLEVFLGTLTVACLLRALDGEERDSVDAGLGRTAARGWRTVRRSMAAGAALGTYLLAWSGGAFLVAILLAWVTLQYTLSAFRGRSAATVGRVVAPVAVTALLVVLPFLSSLSRPFLHVASLGALLAVTLVLEVGSRVIRSRDLPRVLLPLGAAALAGAAAAALRVTANATFERAVAFLARLAPGGTALTIGEVRPLLTMSGAVSLGPAWAIFSAPFFLAAAALAALTWQALRHARPAWTLLACWSATIFVATLAQVRFGYYLAVNIALLTAFLCRSLWGRGGWRRGAAAAVAVAAFSPCLRPALATASDATGPPREWRDALQWLRGHTPPPMGSDDAYFGRVAPPPGDDAYAYPPSAYGVLAWWDYGYWVLRVARRIPNANPTLRGADTVASFLASDDPPAAWRILDRAGTRYVIVDGNVGRWSPGQVVQGSGMFAAVLSWAGEDLSRVRDVFWTFDSGGRAQPFVLYRPEYYRSMGVRLYLYGGEAARPAGSTWVVSTSERRDRRGRPFAEVTSARKFDTFEAAEAFRARQVGPGWHLGGVDPAATCVPLEPVGRLRLVHESMSGGGANVDGRERVRIFEYTGWKPAEQPRP